MKSALFVNGFGLESTAINQSSVYVLRPVGVFAITTLPAAHSLNNVMTCVVNNDVAHIFHIRFAKTD